MAASLQASIDSDAAVLNILLDAQGAVSAAVSAHQTAISLVGYSGTVSEYMGKLNHSISALQDSIRVQKQALAELQGLENDQEARARPGQETNPLQAILGELRGLTSQNDVIAQQITQLKEGSKQANAGLGTLQTTSQALTAGADKLDQSAGALDTGAKNLTSSSATLNAGAREPERFLRYLKRRGQEPERFLGSYPRERAPEDLTDASSSLTAGAATLAWKSTRRS